MTATVSGTSEASLLEQRRVLCSRMTAQRQLIKQQLSPTVERHRRYPRSKTMRFLMQQPILAAGLLAALATVLVGARFFRTMTATLAFTRAISSIAGSRQYSTGATPTAPYDGADSYV